jgi:hypothetical protein
LGINKYRKYFTGYISWDWGLYPKVEYKGKGWFIKFEKTKASAQSNTTYNGKRIQSREVVIYARSLKSAQNVLTLINCGLWLNSGEPEDENEIVLPENEKELNSSAAYADDYPRNHFKIEKSHYPRACLIASRASFRNRYKYALAKFRFASRLHSIYLVDIDPRSATEHLGVSPNIYDHVRFAYSIIASYSVIEEMGLEIRATERKPSMISGQWNPIVKEDLEKRLKQAGVNLKDHFPWDLRGKPTRVEKAKRLPSQGKCSWAKGPYVRDCELEIIDAINIASFLRSKVSSHKMNKLCSSLTSYDVENVKHLARRLLLSQLGLWGKFKWKTKGQVSTSSK